MSRNPGALVVGPTFVDIVMSEMSRLPAAGEEVHVGNASWAPGGYAISAIVLNRLGISTQLVTDIGEDELGATLVSRLQREGLSTDAVFRSDRTNIAVALNWSGDRGIVSYTHPLTDPTERVESQLQDGCDLVLLSARHPHARSVAAAAFAHSVPVALSLSWHPEFLVSPSLKQLFPYARYLFCNVPEALLVTGETDFVRALGILGEAVPEVVVTRGAEGVAALVDGEFIEVPAEPAIMVDATGAGDVFAATYLACALRALDLRDRLSAATWAAAQAVRKVGGSTGAPNWNDVTAHLGLREGAK
ncbi:carbohydrate kinase family protein [Sulfobacillus harzensis]|uniref:Carbohydrate kinase family protein n=1 Tax=Sulfobacillus harzensis TaxID=2729629 RepID=A0A7Y0L418_9FIRM|nr:carbohydrate kinase family protein [Sulfobacillus harzensis]NMP22913.1 carbohydrate kinase family protein [Sulfobacillus harzensis]